MDINPGLAALLGLTAPNLVSSRFLALFVLFVFLYLKNTKDQLSSDLENSIKGPSHYFIRITSGDLIFYTRGSAGADKSTQTISSPSESAASSDPTLFCNVLCNMLLDRIKDTLQDAMKTYSTDAVRKYFLVFRKRCLGNMCLPRWGPYAEIAFAFKGPL